MAMGPNNGEVVGLEDNGLLASRGSEIPKTIPIAASARWDGGTDLPKGMVLVLVTDTADQDYGLYKEFKNDGTSPPTNGQADESTAVVLQHDVDITDVAEGESKKHAAAYLEGVFKRDKVKVDSASTFDYSKQQNITLWPQG